MDTVGTIKCDDLEQFAELCEIFTKKGLVFKAHGAILTIQLTGGY